MMKKFLMIATMSLFAASAVAAEKGCVETGSGELRCGTIILK